MYILKVDPVQFQVNPCNFKLTRAISSEPVQFKNIGTIPTYRFCIVVGNSHTISIVTRSCIIRDTRGNYQLHEFST